MSLLALGLQIAATGAISEVMPAWVRVEMEPAEPLSLVEEGGKVLVATFIGDEVSAPVRRRWFDATTTIELVVQVILPPEVVAVVGGVEQKFDTKRGGARPIYATVHRMIERAFNAPAPDSWGEVLQAIVLAHPDELHGMPGLAERANKVAIPLIDYSIPCRTISSPPLGGTPPHPWPLLVSKMRADPEFAQSADFVEALIAGEPLPAWRAELALAGLSRIEGAALGLGAIPGIEDWPVTEQITVVGDLGSTVEVAS